MKNLSAEPGDVADDGSDFADRMPSQKRIVTPARSPRRRAFEGPQNKFIADRTDEDDREVEAWTEDRATG